MKQKQMRKIELDELKSIQLDILSTVDEFCRKENINYSLGCGSMLGAARHKGYIPWDDDIDIYLLRDDYNKLINMFPQELNSILLLSLERDKRWNKAYAKAVDARTVMQDAGKLMKVGIDVYPIDRVPEGEKEWLRYDRRRRRFQLVYRYKVSMLYRKGREWWRYLFLPFVKLLLLPISSRRIAKFLDRYSQKYNKTTSPYVFECCQGIFQKRRFLRATLQNTIDVPFEGRTFRGMEDYDNYLTNAYGDWQKLPPKEKQVSHHLFEAWWA